MAEENPRLLGLWITLGLGIIFPTMLYAPQYMLIAMILGAVVMIVPIMFSDFIIAIIMASSSHITGIIYSQWYGGANQHLYFDYYTENIVDGINSVVLYLSRPWPHPKHGKIYYVQIRMKGRLTDRFDLTTGWAAAFGTIFKHATTDRATLIEQAYDSLPFDQFNGIMPVLRLVVAGKDCRTNTLVDIIDKYYNPIRDDDLQREPEKKIVETIKSIVEPEVTST